MRGRRALACSLLLSLFRLAHIQLIGCVHPAPVWKYNAVGGYCEPGRVASPRDRWAIAQLVLVGGLTVTATAAKTRSTAPGVRNIITRFLALQHLRPGHVGRGLTKGEGAGCGWGRLM